MDVAAKTNITEKSFFTFLKISIRLTGFGENELLATGMHEKYYYTIMKDTDQDTVREFFDMSEKILMGNASNDEKLNKEIEDKLFPDTNYNSYARKIIMLWYTGIWRTEIKDKDGKLKPFDEMVSAESYTQGLIWVVAEAHPAGAKQPGYASWGLPPL